MPFESQRAAIERLENRTPLTDDDLRDLLPWVRVLRVDVRENLQAELMLMQMLALRRQEQLATRQLESFDNFDKSTANANRWMLRYTAAVTFMTLVMLGIALYPLLRWVRLLNWARF